MHGSALMFGCDKALIGMVHVGALPGTPFSETTIERIAAQAAAEAEILVDAGVDAVMIENMHDRPYVWGGHGPEVAACMTRVGLEVRRVTEKPLGVQVLAGGHREALAVALAVGAEFVRVENFVFAQVADEGLTPEATAGALLRYRRMIGAEHVKVLADIKKKHASHTLTGDLSLSEAVHGAAFFGADGVIVTGTRTGSAALVTDVEAARRAGHLPVVVGSGVTPENVAGMLAHADAVIVGSWLKTDGVWTNAVDGGRARRMVEAVASAHGARLER